jgi:uncharacterized cupredoxin-like copper-binding protein
VDHLGYPRERPHFRRTLKWGAALAGAFLVLGLVGGCTASDPAAAGSVVNVTLHDFRIDSESTSVSGDQDVIFRIDNQAPVTHEFVVVRSDLPPDQLAIGSDGLSVDEDQLDPMGEIGEVESGTIQTLALHLSPGHYVFFCNLEGHYLGGMHGGLEVSGA